jgi:hypothetical protein
MLTELGGMELKLLVYLQEHSQGSGQRIGLDPKCIAKALRIRPEQLAKDSIALAGHSLAGVRAVHGDSNESDAGKISSIWLTGKGEEYLRRLAADAGVGIRITADLVTQMGDSLTGIAAKVLKDYPSQPV